MNMPNTHFFDTSELATIFAKKTTSDELLHRVNVLNVAASIMQRIIRNIQTNDEYTPNRQLPLNTDTNQYDTSNYVAYLYTDRVGCHRMPNDELETLRSMLDYMSEHLNEYAEDIMGAYLMAHRNNVEPDIKLIHETAYEAFKERISNINDTHTPAIMAEFNNIDPYIQP